MPDFYEIRRTHGGQDFGAGYRAEEGGGRRYCSRRTARAALTGVFTQDAKPPC